PRVQLGRARLGDLQAVPGRVLWPVHRGERGALPRGHGDHDPGDHPAEEAGGGAVTRAHKVRNWLVGLLAIAAATVVFIVPFVFVVLQASKERTDAASLSFSLPQQWAFWENLVEVLDHRNNVVPRAFLNSTILTVVSVALMVVLAAM